LDGSVVLEIPMAPFFEVLGLILQHAGDAVVLGPRALRDTVQAEIDRLGAIYRG